MQALTDGPRAAYTAAQVQYLIENTPSFDVDMGLELIDLDLTVIDPDIGQWMTACSVSRSNFATIHSECKLSISTDLPWGNAIVRPYQTLTGTTSPTDAELTTMKFYQGAYFLDVQEEDLSEVPSVFDVQGLDILSILDDSIGDDYSIDTGVLYLARVEEILLSRGISRYHIDQDAWDKAAAAPKTYSLDEDPTWLQVVNDCLAAIGYQGIWTDQLGEFQVRAYTTPSARAPEWVLTADVENTLLTQRRKRSREFYGAPNRWVFYQSNVTEEQPVDGDGRYEFTNETAGETSVEARGRVITAKPQGVDVADHDSLVAYAQRVIDADMQIPTRFSIETAPLPTAWHMDRYLVSDPQIGAATDVLGVSWSRDLSGSDMSHEWSAVS